MTEDVLSRRVVELRAAFDDAFAYPVRELKGATEDLLVVRVSGDPFAFRTCELSGLAAQRKVVPLSSQNASVIGIAAIRGALFTAYSLDALLGYGQPSGSPRWLALCGRPDSVALAFDTLGGFVRVARDSLRHPSEPGRSHLAEVVAIDSTTLRVIDTQSILTAVRAGARRTAEEG